MKRILAYILAVVALCPVMRAADGDLFPYPKPPEDLSSLSDRCNFLVTKFWNQCDFKSAMSKKDKLNSTFGDWISFMPYASADSVHAAIDRVIAKNEKNGPIILEMARMAENWVYGDTAQFISEEIYLPFAQAAANNKKISAADRARFQRHVQIIGNTTNRKSVKHLNWETPDGAKGSIDDIHTQIILIFFNDHDCDDCSMARIRLSADINATSLIKNGLMTVLCIEPNESTTEWLAAAASYPKDWVIGASADADDWFNRRSSPSFLLLDARHRILAKDVPVDNILSVLANIRQNTGL